MVVAAGGIALPPAHPLSAWSDFYVILGSSGAALIGLQFVVIALIESTGSRATAASISAFGTPTVIHLAGALVVSAVVEAPWPSLTAASVALALCGLGGLLYGAVVLDRARRQEVYRPVWEDWLWHVVLPDAAYAALTVAGLLLRAGGRVPPFVIGGAALSLLLIGIHNSWDTVAYLVVERARPGSGGRGEGA